MKHNKQMLFVALAGLSALSMHAEFFQWAGCRTRTLFDWINDTEAAETVETTYPFFRAVFITFCCCDLCVAVSGKRSEV